ncbi:MAG: flagellar basal-body MS-ring/collar protein FliF [Eubacteriales bacterium]|nr:flagellar basal-body MS-ring/collar protein FliF [Eubacteriales bacterium]MDD4390134.1 flagellar basal-body MS-ring/collar protein FliF [Eubacteriales bacterium]
MNEQIKKIIETFKQFWSNASSKMRKIIIAGAVITLILAVALSIVLNSKDYVVIFEDLAATENTEIMAKLQEMGVDAKTEGGSIMVLKEEESNVRMSLATEGYPKSGLNYYLIEQSSGMLTTDYQRKQYETMQLQERIAASIKTLENVKDAVVTIAAPGDSSFYLQEKEDPTASIIVHMKSGTSLSEKQIIGIQNLVSGSVVGLKNQNVTILDGQGNDLIEGDSIARTPEQLKLNITREIESDLRKKVYGILDGPYDSSKIKVAVTATINVDDLVTEENLYQPSDDGDNTGVVSEETSTDESSSSTQQDGGVPGTESNSQIPTYTTNGGSGNSSSSSSSENIKYQVSQIKSQSQNKGAKIEAISIGVAVDKASFEAGERESVMELVAFAAGVAPEDVTVQNFRFSQPDEETMADVAEESIKSILPFIIIGAVLLIIILTVVLLLLRARKKKQLEEELAIAERIAEEEKAAALNTLFGKDGQPIEGVDPIPIKQPLDLKRDEIKEFAISNPEIAAQMIKSWLRSDGDS